MSILSRILGGLLKWGKGSGADGGAYYYVRCSKCGEVIQVRVDTRWDLQQAFDDDGDAVSGYIVTKDVMGSKCFRMMRMIVRFDRGRREIEREVEGGEFVEKEDFEQATGSQAV